MRRAEQVASCAAVEVGVVEFLDHSDGLVVQGIDLHRAVGRALIDAACDAGNPWLFSDLPDVAWSGSRFVAFSGSPQATHAVDITDQFDAGIDSLLCHEVYLRNLDGDMADPDAFLRSAAEQTGPRLGVDLATAFEFVWL